MIWFFLLSGLFLGWSLGANDASNVFGTAVGTKMIRFKMAAAIASIFVILGAVISGSGATETLETLGSVNALAGSFTVALSAALTIFWMTRAKLTVSTSQAIVGAIVGWNLFTGSPTNLDVLLEIVSTWVMSPVLSGIFAVILFLIFRFFLNKTRIHVLEVDILNRFLLILVGAFGAYSLGANNIANVMGVFVPAAPFRDFVFGSFTFTGTQQLFLLGGVAISVGIFTYSYQVMMTVGHDLFKLTPASALVVVLAQALVLFLFASQGLQHWLLAHGLPALPLVPVSSSQAVVGAVIGIGLVKGARGIHFSILGKISLGWVLTPVLAGLLTFILLYIVKNVFELQVVIH
ncbi:MAG: inorganic phosphate transporter [Calditrichia bacterium]|jgi:PiT family inorganic phosphate transporter